MGIVYLVWYHRFTAPASYLLTRLLEEIINFRKTSTFLLAYAEAIEL